MLYKIRHNPLCLITLTFFFLTFRLDFHTMPRLKEKLVPTTLNFAPNFPGNMVEVALGCWLEDGYYVVVCGEDDCSLQTETLTFSEAQELYDKLDSITWESIKPFKGSINNNGFPSIP